MESKQRRYPKGRNHPTLACFLAIAATATLVGCGGEYRKVYGVVTVNGEPLKLGKITFYPKEGRSGSGRIQPDGSYQITSIEPGDGLKPGEYLVAIEAKEISSGGPPAKSFGEELAGIGNDTTLISRELIDPKYSNPATSGLTATVESSGSNEHNFDLE